MQRRLFFSRQAVLGCDIVKRFSVCVKMNRTYEDAIKALNTLQSNTAALKEICRSGQIRQSDRFEKTKEFAARAKVPVDKLDKLAAIHISGTKGKGSVCAFCDSILRENGLKTGFYSSPHLVEVRERIRINGKLICKDEFARYFWKCWDNLKQDESNDMPPYFVFLTIMSFYIFLQEKVDVAIIEVGIGGAFDTTNILRQPWACGVTSLGHDHVAVLGGTTESIAWNKAGIFKCGVPAFTVPQDEISTRVLAQRAKELKAPLKVVPELCSYPGETVTSLGIEGRHQFLNASLALQLCNTWLDRYRKETNGNDNCYETPAVTNEDVQCEKLIPSAEPFPINLNMKFALEKTYWPGRSHCIKRNNYTLYLDGAHTPKSINACSTWFCKRADEEKNNLSPRNVARVLIFNCTGERDSRKLLAPLVSCDFDFAIFCTNSITEESARKSSDLSDFTASLSSRLKRCHENHEAWKRLTGETGSITLHDLDKKLRANAMQNSCVFSSVLEALHCVLAEREPLLDANPEHSRSPRVLSHANHIQVVVTGSLHLVGAAMKVLGPSIVQV
ncbi:folylpolyglutamate synthase, mitochondrial-like [Dendronephthya gigantea]|uniref:folylpolyglutamate synthase, mitochondrial-like n=1 Tax=Dendronephthya gigantea TaxID=151771 RepID=UPI00106A5B29|nr:folylpolyglutamate synthase, mitochondrial-like [Dendronephthya gigantea]